MKKKTPFGLLVWAISVILTSCTASLPDSIPETAMTTDAPAALEDSVPSPEPLLVETPAEGPDDSAPDSSDALAALRERAVNRCTQWVDAFNKKTSDGAGWIRVVTDRKQYDESAGGYLEPQTSEHWYRLDAEGYIVAGYGWASAGDDEVLQEFVYLNGWYDEVYYNNWYNLEYDFSAEGDIQRPHTAVDQPLTLIDPDFCALMDGSEMAWLSATEFGGQPAIQFAYLRTVAGLYDGDPLIESLYFGQESFDLLGLDTWWVQPNGNLKNVQSTVYPTIEFDAVPPEARFAEIWARVPHGDTFVPLEEGEP